MSNIAEVNRLLAEKDSSSDDEDDNLGGLSRDTYIDKLYASSKPQRPASQAVHKTPSALASSTKPTTTNDKFMAGTTAQELLDAVSSESSDGEMEAIINSRLKKATSNDMQSKPRVAAEETKKGGNSAKNAEYYEKNWSNAAEREKFILNELGAISSSSDEEGDHGTESGGVSHRSQDKAAMNISKKAAGVAARISNVKISTSQVRQRPVAIVEFNEKQSQHTPDKMIEAASQLLSFDKEFYNVKKELMIYSTFQQITKSLYEESDHPYFGLVSCVRMFRAKNGTVVFVGNSSGYIRVFDVQTQRSMKPLYDNQFFQTKVLCIDISEDGHYLLAGYKKGTLVLWDSAKFKIAHIMRDVTKSESSDFSMVKLLYATDRNEISIVTAEECGRIRLVNINKTLFGGFSHKANSLYESDLKGAATISVQRPSSQPSHYSMFCDMSCLVAFGATNMITIVEMRSFPPRPLKVIKRPAVCKEKSVPAIDWGYGLTPRERERTLPLLVFAWDKIIQLAYIDEATRNLEFDGFYCSDQEINQVYFMADSVLVILVGREEIKVLYTDKFQPGDVSMLGINKPAEELCVNRDFKQIVEGTKASEIETGYVIRDIKPGVVSYAGDSIGDDGQRQLLKVINFNNTICQYKKNIIILGTNKIYRARLLSWREYIDKLKFTDNHDWLTVLKVALEIYNGEIKGFALLPDATERRRSFLKDYMKKLILTSIQTVIFKFKSSGNEASQSDSTHNDSDESYEDNFSIDKIAIKVSIEFCLQISEAEYLFTEIYQFFAEKELEDKFISHLCAPIIAGQFRSEVIPEYILQKMVRMYEDRQEFKVLEKIILNVNVDAYHQNAVGDVANHGKGIRAYLEVVCKSHCMVSALLQLQTSDRSSRQQAGCTQILNMLLGNMEIQKAMAEQNELIRGSASSGASKARKVQKNDMQLLKTADKHRKYEIEQSSVYIGYKLLWILSLFLKGKKFPTGDLDEQQFLAHVLNIVDFVIDEQTLAQLLDFDAESFFQVMLLLFVGKPWKLIANCSNTDYLFEFQKAEITPGAATLGLGGSGKPTGVRILEFFKEAAYRTNRKEPELAQAAFHDLILSIVVGQDSEQKDKRKDREMGLAQRGIHPSHSHTVKEYTKLEIEYALTLAALKNVLSRKEPSDTQLLMCGGGQESAKSAHEINLQLVIDTLRCTKVKAEDIDDITGIIPPTTQLQLIRVKIQLFESKQDYVEAFMLHITNDQLKKGLFKWLTETLASLTKEDIRLRREKETKVEKKKKGKMEFDAGKFEKQNLIDDSSDEEEEQASKRPVSIALSASNSDEYLPLAYLKSAVKQRILELAQLNSEQTVQLVETYLSDGDFQERLIMDKFCDFEEEQLSYLTNYITKNETEIQEAMREDFSAAHQTAARKYEKYLVLFTKLLCKYHKGQVETWVSKPYFPPDKCLSICKEYGNLRGLAILTMRSGKPRDAINVYLEILTSFPMYKLIDQLKLLHKHHRPDFLSYVDEDNNETKNFLSRGDERRNYFVPEQVVSFEQILGKACAICHVDDLDSEQRMDAWFQILRYLQTYMVESFNKVTAALKASKKAHVDVLKEDDKTKYIMQLKDFIMDRINYILRYPGLDIPLKVLVEQLNLTFEQIKDLCGSKLRHNGTTLRIENCQRVLINSQLIDLFTDTIDKMTGGYCVEPNKRLVASKKHPGKRTIKGNTICNQCMSSIVRTRMAEPLVIFQCNHQFHSSCLTEKQKELSVGRKCPICLKQNYLAIKEEREKLEQRQRKRVGRRPGGGARQQSQAEATDDEGESSSASSTNDSSRTERSFIAEEPTVVAASSESLMMRKMEQYDGLLDDISLGYNEFREAMIATK